MPNCGSCGQRGLELTQEEIKMLGQFSQFPFLPVAKNAADEMPTYLEEKEYTIQEYGIILALLEKKGLISIDYEKPLKNADLSAYKGYDCIGSMALTARGISVLEILDLQGCTE